MSEQATAESKKAALRASKPHMPEVIGPVVKSAAPGIADPPAATAPPPAAPTPPPAPPRPAPVDCGGRAPCVGLPVQFHNGAEGVIPGVLQSKQRTEDLWNVKISLNGAGVTVTRTAVPYSPEPKHGCWSFLPGWRYEP
jgi:hypothetical protein